MAEKRAEWKSNQGALYVSHLVFLDESGVNTGMTRLYGRAASHERVIEAVPDTRFHRITIRSSVRLDGTTVPFVFEGTLNGDTFRVYVTQLTGTVTETRRHRRYGQPDSPDLNPIELMWSKIKAVLRKLKVRAKELLDQAIAFAFSCVSSSDISGWFHHDGYNLC